MSFCDDAYAAPQPHREYIKTPRFVSKTHANDDFVSLNDASYAAKKAACRAFTESTNAYDAATTYLATINRILSRNLKHKTAIDDLKITIDGIDAIETNGIEALVRAKHYMREAVTRWMNNQKYNIDALHDEYIVSSRHSFTL